MLNWKRNAKNLTCRMDFYIMLLLDHVCQLITDACILGASQTSPNHTHCLRHKCIPHNSTATHKVVSSLSIYVLFSQKRWRLLYLAVYIEMVFLQSWRMYVYRNMFDGFYFNGIETYQQCLFHTTTFLVIQYNTYTMYNVISAW